MMNRSLKLLLSKQRRLNRKYKKTNCKRVNKKYMHVCKEVKSALGQTVIKYIDSLCGKNIENCSVPNLNPLTLKIDFYVYLLIFVTSWAINHIFILHKKYFQ